MQMPRKERSWRTSQVQLKPNRLAPTWIRCPSPSRHSASTYFDCWRSSLNEWRPIRSGSYCTEEKLWPIDYSLEWRMRPYSPHVADRQDRAPNRSAKKRKLIAEQYPSDEKRIRSTRLPFNSFQACDWSRQSLSYSLDWLWEEKDEP